MKGDPSNPADWPRVAGRDLASARRCLEQSDLPLAVFCLEQAAEKALKSWLIGRGWALIKTHDLQRLINECACRGMDLSLFESSARRLQSLYFTDRYVDDSPDPEPDAVEVAALLAAVERLFTHLFPAPPPAPDASNPLADSGSA